MTDALTTLESEHLAALESVVREGQDTFVRVGIALMEIRDRKLYRAGFKTFDAYCEATFGWSSSYGRRLVKAAEVAKSVPIGTVLNEAQARALAEVEPEKRLEVLRSAAASGKVTAKAISKAAEQEGNPALDDPDSRALRITLKAKATADDFKDFLAGINPTKAELIQAACAFRKLANELDRAASMIADSTAA
jgi:hypothetical protein